MASGRARETLEENALLLRAIPYGESDLVTQLLTESRGRVSAMVRGGVRSRKRAGGAFEPFHTIHARLEDHGGELLTLREASVVVVRLRLVSSLAAMEAAGRVLRWVRALCPPRTPEPEVFAIASATLEALDQLASLGDAPATEVAALTAWAGLALLAATGFGIELDACVACGKACPPDRSALVDVARGGIVCRACGGGGVRFDAETRRSASRVGLVTIDAIATEGVEALGAPGEVRAVARLAALVSRALEHHEIERSRHDR